jgi:crossover junction endodeoxyribonuclease RuvC
VIIIGVDPGTKITGYGIIKMEGNTYRALDYGCIKPPPNDKLSERYLIIYNGICELLERYKPQALVVETQYVNKNVQSAIKLGMARGVIIIAAKQKGIAVYEYYPTQPKLAVVGNGRASKAQVQGMVKALLSLVELPEPEDAADALSLAICHAQSHRQNRSCKREI